MTYGRAANDATLLAVQIETVRALDALDEIAAVDGIDVYSSVRAIWPSRWVLAPADGRDDAGVCRRARARPAGRARTRKACRHSRVRYRGRAPLLRLGYTFVGRRQRRDDASRRCDGIAASDGSAADGSDGCTANDAVLGLRGVGPVIRAQARRDGDSHGGQDLANVYPRDYKDWREPVPIGQIVRETLARGAARDGPESVETIAVGTVTSVREFRGRVPIVSAQLEDASGTMKATWFGRRGFAGRLAVGERVFVHGRVALEAAARGRYRRRDERAPSPRCSPTAKRIAAASFRSIARAKTLARARSRP